MNNEEKLRAIEITKEIKADLRTTIEKYASEVSGINQANDDPHTPIIGCMQMAFAQAATEYMITSGAKPNEAVMLTVNTIGTCMQQWCNSILKPVPKIIK